MPYNGIHTQGRSWGGEQQGRPATESNKRQNWWKNEYCKPSYERTNRGVGRPIIPIARHFRIVCVCVCLHNLQSRQNSNKVPHK